MRTSVCGFPNCGTNRRPEALHRQRPVKLIGANALVHEELLYYRCRRKLRESESTAPLYPCPTCAQVPVGRAEHVVGHPAQQPEDNLFALPTLGRGGIDSRGCLVRGQGRDGRQSPRSVRDGALWAAIFEVRAVKHLALH